MTEKGKKDASSTGWAPVRGGSLDSASSHGAGDELDRLPPPVFPPGSGRRSASVIRPDIKPTTVDDFPEGAYISPDEPIRRRVDVLDGALISPDEPIRRDERGVEDRRESEDDEEGVATGMSDEGPIYDQARMLRPETDAITTRKAAESLEALARDLRAKGAASLAERSDTSRFDALLRGLVAGYLLGVEER